MIRCAYSKAEFFEQCYGLLEDIVRNNQVNLAEYIEYSITKMCEYIGIDLFFLESKTEDYKQYKNEFISNLSIIDIIMFNSQEKISELLEQYVLIQ